MRCHPYNISFPRCANCNDIARCSVHDGLTKKQLDEYHAFLMEYISRYPNKYKLGVVMNEVKQQKNMLIVDGSNPVTSIVSSKDIDNMSDQDKLALVGKSIYQVSKRYTIRLKIDLVPVPLVDDKTTKSKVKK